MFLPLLAVISVMAACVMGQLADRPEMFKDRSNDTSLISGVGVDHLGDYSSDSAGWASLWHSETAYCLDFEGRNYDANEYTKSFVFTYHIQDTSRHTEGYIGYQPDIKAIVVSFRGSEDFQNWLSDLEVIRVDYPLCEKCSVHKGFYHAEQAVYSGILGEIKRLRGQYPSYDIVSTGHSLGAALATLVALDLGNDGFNNVKLYNYGSPRLFNQAAANYASASGSGISIKARRTHYKDIVVHSPMHSMGFVHTTGEIYEDGPSSTYPDYNGGPLKNCDGEEDPSCADQWSFTSASDHLLYSGLVMGEGGCGVSYGSHGSIPSAP
jgi:predicted lipase